MDNDGNRDSARGAEAGTGSGRQQGGRAADLASTAKDAARQVQEGAGATYRRAAGATRESYDRASEWASKSYDNAARGADGLRKRSASEFDRVRQTAEELVRHNPVMIGVAGLAAGLLIGALLPRTQRENEVFGRLSDDLREQGKQYALDMAREGKERLLEAFDPQQSGAAPAAAQDGGDQRRANSP